MTTSTQANAGFGVRLRRLRRQQAMTQMELAEAARTSHSTIVRLERGIGEARPSTIRRLAVALGVPLQSLTVG